MHTHYGHTNIRGAAFGAALLAVLLFPSCTAEGPESVSGGEGREFLLSASVPSFTAGDGVPATKGFVEGTSLYDSEGGNRSLYLTAYLHAQNGNDGEYLSGEAFNTSDGSTWRHDPPVYWPLGGRMDLLAYSSAAPFDEFDVAWGGENCAERMRLSVGHDRTQDDILYGSAWGEGNSFSATSLQMHHTQAWIQVVLKKDSALSDEVVVHSVELLDTYIGGDLLIENNYGHPEISWNFRRFEARDRAVDDLDGVCGTPLPSSERVLNMLVPQQEMKSIRIKYSQGGEEKSAVKELPHATWLAGKKYVYEIGFKKALELTGFHNGHQWVDLGLRREIDGVNYRILFATVNVGADSPEEIGNYYSYAETSVKYSGINNRNITGTDFSLINTPYYNGDGSTNKSGWIKYIPTNKASYWSGEGDPDNLIEIETSDDVASVMWGGNWRIPSRDDLSFLTSAHTNSFTYEWTDDYNSTGIKGRIYTGKGEFSPNSIFIPAGGSCFMSWINGLNYNCTLQSRNIITTSPELFEILVIGNSGAHITQANRSDGVSVRPVLIVPE